MVVHGGDYTFDTVRKHDTERRLGNMMNTIAEKTRIKMQNPTRNCGQMPCKNTEKTPVMDKELSTKTGGRRSYKEFIHTMYSSPTVPMRAPAPDAGVPIAKERMKADGHNNSYGMFQWDKTANPTHPLKKTQEVKSKEETQNPAIKTRAKVSNRHEPESSHLHRNPNPNPNPNPNFQDFKKSFTKQLLSTAGMVAGGEKPPLIDWTKKEKEVSRHIATRKKAATEGNVGGSKSTRRPSTAGGSSTTRTSDSNHHRNPVKAFRSLDEKWVDHPIDRNQGLRTIMHHDALEPWLDPFADHIAQETVDGSSITMKPHHSPIRGKFGKPGEKMHGTYGLHRPQSALGRIHVDRGCNSPFGCADNRFPWGGGARALLTSSPVPYSSQTRSIHSEMASTLALAEEPRALQFRHKLRHSIEHQFPLLHNPLYNGSLKKFFRHNGTIGNVPNPGR